LSSIVWDRKETRLEPFPVAVEMARRGAPEGTVVLGRARARRVLAFSVILRPVPGPPTELLGLIATFCASDGIRKDTGIITWLRWPDVVVAGSDAVAATSLLQGEDGEGRWAILSFRINLGNASTDGSTSLYDLLGVDVDSEMLLSKILDSLAWMHSGWVKEMYPQVLARISSMLENAGGRVAVEREGRAVPGVVRGVDELGRLVVDLDETAQVRVVRRSDLLPP
jgi:BirA family biotin operon repressor/biotin-[acetyl-CoA-carboxylase] ligase